MYALGSYSDDKTKNYDKDMLFVIRTLWVVLHIVTCLVYHRRKWKGIRTMVTYAVDRKR